MTTTTPRHRAASGQGSTTHAPAVILAVVFLGLLGLCITLSITGL